MAYFKYSNLSTVFINNVFINNVFINNNYCTFMKVTSKLSFAIN